MHDRLDAGEAFNRLAEVRQIRLEIRRRRLCGRDYIYGEDLMLVVDELPDDGTAGLPTCSGDDDLHAGEAYEVWRRILGLGIGPASTAPAEPDRTACGP
jgi:hypothetical protein